MLVGWVGQSGAAVRRGVWDAGLGRGIAGVVLLSVVALLGFATPGQATQPGSNGNIAYDSYICITGCDDDSYTVSPRPGSRPTDFAHPDVQGISDYVNDVAFAPQAGRVAFVGYKDNESRSWVAVGTLASPHSGTLTSVARVTQQRLLCPGHPTCVITAPRWSPTGRRLLYARSNESGSDGRIIEVNLASRRTSPIGPIFKAGDDLEPDWASTGEIVLSTATARCCDDRGLVVMSAGGRHVRTLTTGYSDSSPSWSPDGKKIAFVRGTTSNDPCPKVYTIRANGRALKRITDGCDDGVAWSPDGTRLATARSVHSRDTLAVIPAGGGPARRITGGSAGYGMDSLDWQPLSR
jgi:TolB protein